MSTKIAAICFLLICSKVYATEIEFNETNVIKLMRSIETLREKVVERSELLKQEEWESDKEFSIRKLGSLNMEDLKIFVDALFELENNTFYLSNKDFDIKISDFDKDEKKWTVTLKSINPLFSFVGKFDYSIADSKDIGTDYSLFKKLIETKNIKIRFPVKINYLYFSRIKTYYSLLKLLEGKMITMDLLSPIIDGMYAGVIDLYDYFRFLELSKLITKGSTVSREKELFSEYVLNGFMNDKDWFESYLWNERVYIVYSVADILILDKVVNNQLDIMKWYDYSSSISSFISFEKDKTRIFKDMLYGYELR